MSRPTYVYVIAGEGLGFVKIGIAYNVDARVKQVPCIPLRCSALGSVRPEGRRAPRSGVAHVFR